MEKAFSRQAIVYQVEHMGSSFAGLGWTSSLAPTSGKQAFIYTSLLLLQPLYPDAPFEREPHQLLRTRLHQVPLLPGLHNHRPPAPPISSWRQVSSVLLSKQVHLPKGSIFIILRMLDM